MLSLHQNIFSRRRYLDKFGVRIYPLDNEVILIKQTIKRVGSPTYVVDVLPNGDHREAHVSIASDAGIADAVRSALQGGLLHT
jgi:hypothetical protein